MLEELNKLKEELQKVKQELERTKIELSILYEISNAMRTTLNLDEILYIILTGVTAHIGLGFNRAMLFLINEKENLIEGRLGIGPDSAEEAGKIWKQIEEQKMDLDDLISAYKFTDYPKKSSFNQLVQNLRFALNSQNQNLLSFAVSEGMPLHITSEIIKKYENDPIIKILNTEELAIVPLKAKDQVNGLVVADNFITKEPITKDELRMLVMLANQAGLAIENSRLYEKALLRANTDPLTELWNHGYFQQILRTEINKAQAKKTNLSLVMLDIDDFKIYNDILGHQSGDRILKDLANILRNQSRKMDYVCRYGGEEFTIILPDTSKKEAFLLAERLREVIERHHFYQEEILPHKRLTVSIG
ncbi:MAG: sensor domain-containing diguanylate cyclase, partial [Candidatus Omnitrophica bacterium]|nr:sensor domain-containing diguanylate cyclase [Candidatus Omnitrophota bacterium]